MKVKDLINQLKDFNEDADVRAVVKITNKEKLSVKTVDVNSTARDVSGNGDFKILLDVEVNNEY